MTYVLPMTMDNLDTYRGMVIFCVLMAILFFLNMENKFILLKPCVNGDGVLGVFI